MASRLDEIEGPSWAEWLARGVLAPGKAGAEGVKAAYGAWGDLQDRMINAMLQYNRGEGYDPGPALESAMLPVGGTAFSAPKGALGAGPAMSAKDKLLAEMQYIQTGKNPASVGLPSKGEFGSISQPGAGFSPLPKKIDPETAKLLAKVEAASKSFNKPKLKLSSEEEAEQALKLIYQALREGSTSAKPTLGKTQSGATLAELEPISGPVSTPWKPKSIGTLNYASLKRISPEDLPRETPFGVPERGKAVGFEVPAVHGTINAPSGSGWVGKKSLEKDFGSFRLPADEIGVHFGGPRAAASFTDVVGEGYYPRKFPVTLQARNPLEMQDLGSWGPGKIAYELKRLGFKEDEILKARYGMSKIEPGSPTPYKSSEQQTRGLRNFIQSKGYDSIKYINTVEDPGHTSYIMIRESAKEPGRALGVRSPWAKYDPANLGSADILAGLGGLAALPAVLPKENRQ